jgi:alanine dehydrogenase
MRLLLRPGKKSERLQLQKTKKDTQMKIGVPREIKNREHRVSVTPEGVLSLVAAGHELYMQSKAGVDSGFSDAAYIDAGAIIVDAARQAWACELVVKVKEPLTCEYQYLRPDLILFTFLHLAADRQLVEALLKYKVCAIAYETVQLKDGCLPLLASMSQVAGRVAVQLGVHFLQRENGTEFPGKGRLAGGISSVPGARVVILGGGNVGCHAAEASAGLGAEVIVLEADSLHLRNLQASLSKRIRIEYFSADILVSLLPDCDLLIGAALIPGKHAPGLLRREHLRLMQPGSVFIDVSIDQGGICETSRPTTYENPLYVEEGVLHCCLPNLPAAVPETSTRVLTLATLPYVRLLADKGIEEALLSDPALARGVNTREGQIVHEGVAASFTHKI